MIELSNIKSIYFIGIGGIGMSNLARYFAGRGVTVSGYDKTATQLTRQLEAEDIAIHYEEDLSQMDRNADLVVYTPAVPATHAELVYFRENKYHIVKRSDLLGAITNESFNICVAGTHGKTTTTTMVAHILRHSGYGCNAFLGGIAANYNSNFWSSERDVCVAEADEYDRSFLKLSPNIAIISSMDPDHLDIYGTPEAVEEAFVDFSARIKPKGLLISKYDLPRQEQLKGDRQLTYSREDDRASVYAKNISMKHGSYQFDLVHPQQTITGITLNMGGLHNVENVVAAIAVAIGLEIDADRIRAAVADFKGVKRRFEYVLGPADHNGRVILIDDYAHHPAELTALLTSAKGLFSNRKCTVIFQPHLYSRTNDLADGFAKALDLADEVVLLPIYPARELPMEGVSSRMIAERMHKHAILLDKADLTAWVEACQPSLLVMAGAGDIDTLVLPVKAVLDQQNN